jgi:hypothetical protein
MGVEISYEWHMSAAAKRRQLRLSAHHQHISARHQTSISVENNFCGIAGDWRGRICGNAFRLPTRLRHRALAKRAHARALAESTEREGSVAAQAGAGGRRAGRATPTSAG